VSRAEKEVSFSSTLLVNSVAKKNALKLEIPTLIVNIVAKKQFSQKYTNNRSLFSVLKVLGMERVKPGFS
jgi:hypothetical protein